MGKKILKLTTFIFVSIAIFFGLATTFNLTKDNKNNNTNLNSLGNENLLNTKGSIKQFSMYNDVYYSTTEVMSAIVHDAKGDHMYRMGGNEYFQQGTGSREPYSYSGFDEVKNLNKFLPSSKDTIKQISTSKDTSAAIIHSYSNNRDELYM